MLTTKYYSFNKLFQKSCFILGKENCEFIAKEGALKIKEVIYMRKDTLQVV